jgi:hypothetical protein
MRKAAPPTKKPVSPPPEPAFNVYFVIASILTLFVPIFVLPAVVDNGFNTPKSLLIQLGACLMAGAYSVGTGTAQSDALRCGFFVVLS